jgi:L-alanine-DL-glutamate epimerase-like enolase superfamily enzyme
MARRAIRIQVTPLRLKLKTTIRHAGATRHAGESLLAEASREGQSGYGEGCPRTYVAGDDIESSLQWLREFFPGGHTPFTELKDLKRWGAENGKLIDRYPSAWCAVEMALLDLFSREQACSVETLLGLSGQARLGRYSAVLGDDNSWTYAAVCDKYLILGMSDFKIKLNGDLDRDREKIAILADLAAQHRSGEIRIRLDANNLWKDRCDEAIAHIQALGGRAFAVEEPVGPRAVEEISRVSIATGIPVIIDESLCTREDLSLFREVPGQLIANVKLSRVGGLIRALDMIGEIRKLGWPVIIGCHVGETSLLTRAALIAARAAGENLLAMEGAFGDALLEWDPAEPTLKFGHAGLLDLNAPYFLQTDQGPQVVPPESWNRGLGLNCRLSRVADAGVLAVPLEKPAAVAAEILSFIRKGITP